MNNIFQEIINKGVMVIYMDNILIFSGQTKEQHHTIVVHVLDILCKHWLYLRAKKCTFGQMTVEYLSLILLEGHVEMDPVKVAGIHDWQTLRSVTEIMSFMGLSTSTSVSSRTSSICPSPYTNSPEWRDMEMDQR